VDAFALAHDLRLRAAVIIHDSLIAVLTSDSIDLRLERALFYLSGEINLGIAERGRFADCREPLRENRPLVFIEYKHEIRKGVLCLGSPVATSKVHRHRLRAAHPCQRLIRLYGGLLASAQKENTG